MSSVTNVVPTLDREARSLLTRLDRVSPYALVMPMVPAAAVSRPAALGIERRLMGGRRDLRRRVEAYRRFLHGQRSLAARPSEAQRRFAFLKMKFNAVLTQFDIFADVLSQRAEHGTGVWLGGLDVAATEALTLRGAFFDQPPIVTYLDRGFGAAIRRARTRLPGGDRNPVAVIRVPRERMVGSGIASSLVHEVGHQGAALLDLLPSLREALHQAERSAPAGDRLAWQLWERWISEIAADFWSVAKLGIGATQGLMNVVSLPRAFVFRIATDDPHPFPWIRVVLSASLGNALYPDPQWHRLVRVWETLYPADSLDPSSRRIIASLRRTMPGFVRLLVNHRPRSLRGNALAAVFPVAQRQPARLRALFAAWRRSPARMSVAPPSLAFAVLGQATHDGRITPERESRQVASLLTRWALRRVVLGEADAGSGKTISNQLARVRAVRAAVA